MSCPDHETLSAFSDGEVPEQQATQIREHATYCPDCREFLKATIEQHGGKAQTAATVRETISKCASGFASGFTTSDARKTYEEYKRRGVEIADELTERDYGTDFGIRDPFGNHIRVVQLAASSPQLGPKTTSTKTASKTAAAR